MEKEFKLDEKILPTQRIVNGKLIDQTEGSISTEDVKEFIRLLKKDFCYCQKMMMCENCFTINKLVGEELSQGEKNDTV